MTLVKEYSTVEEAVQGANLLYSKGVMDEEVYVLAHERDVTNEVADRSKAEKIGMDETGVGTAMKNLFRSTGDTLRAKMEEVGLSPAEAQKYEERLDNGKILLLSKNDQVIL